MATRVRPGEWRRSVGQNDGMERAVALSAETVASAGLYSSVVTTAPGRKTEIHHHGPCETSIYVLAGRARFTFGPGGVEHSFEAEVGDFVYIPAHEVHVEENASDTDPLVVIVTRNCPDALTLYVGADGGGDADAGGGDPSRRST